MASFIKLGEDTGTWASKSRALEFLSQGYEVYEDETMKKKLTKNELNAISESVSCENSQSTVKIVQAQNEGG